MVKIEFKNFNNPNIKKKKKAVTLYLNEETYRYVKEHLKNQSVSSFIDGILEQIEKFIKERDKLEKEKKEKNKKDGVSS